MFSTATDFAICVLLRRNSIAFTASMLLFTSGWPVVALFRVVCLCAAHFPAVSFGLFASLVAIRYMWYWSPLPGQRLVASPISTCPLRLRGGSFVDSDIEAVAAVGSDLSTSENDPSEDEGNDSEDDGGILQNEYDDDDDDDDDDYEEDDSGMEADDESDGDDDDAGGVPPSAPAFVAEPVATAGPSSVPPTASGFDDLASALLGALPLSLVGAPEEANDEEDDGGLDDDSNNAGGPPAPAFVAIPDTIPAGPAVAPRPLAGGVDDFVPALLGALTSLSVPPPDVPAAPSSVFPRSSVSVPVALPPAGFETAAPGVLLGAPVSDALALAVPLAVEDAGRGGIVDGEATGVPAGEALALAVPLAVEDAGRGGIVDGEATGVPAGEALALAVPLAEDDAGLGGVVDGEAAGGPVGAVDGAFPIAEERGGASGLEPSPMDIVDDMDIDSDDEGDRVCEDPEGVWDPMDIQEDATMMLRRGGWRRVTPVLLHGRRRRVMALPLGVPAYRFAGPYTVPWYQGSSSCIGRRRNTQTGALVKAIGAAAF